MKQALSESETITALGKIVSFLTAWVTKPRDNAEAPIARQLLNLPGKIRIWRGLAPEGSIPTDAKDKKGNVKLPIPFFVMARGAKDGAKLDKGRLHVSSSDIHTDIYIDPSLDVFQSTVATLAALLHLAYGPETSDGKTVWYTPDFKQALKTAGFDEATAPPRILKPSTALAGLLKSMLKDAGLADAVFPILTSFRNASAPSRLVAFKCSADEARLKGLGKGEKKTRRCPVLQLDAKAWSHLVDTPCLSNNLPKDHPWNCGGRYLKPGLSKFAQAQKDAKARTKADAVKIKSKGRTVRKSSVDAPIAPDVTIVSAESETKTEVA